MSAEPLRFPAAPSPPAPGAAEWFPAAEPPAGPPGEMDALRRLVELRLAAAVDDILQLVGTTVNRYREQIDRQQRQLDSLKPEEEDRESASSAILPACSRKRCPQNLLSEQLLPPKVKMEDCGGSDAVCDPASGSETDDSADYWRPEDTTAEGCGPSPSGEPSPEGPPAFSCKVCGEPFRRRSYLLSHAAMHARDCSVCGKHLEAPEGLKLHLRAHRETAFCCGVCGQMFTLRGNLRMHMRIHSGERPFACTVCGKSFGRRATLVRHVRSHTGEKPFTCSYCGRGFVEKGNLTVHLRTHTGERPYCCTTCDRRFSQLSCFYKHPCQRRQLNPT